MMQEQQKDQKEMDQDLHKEKDEHESTMEISDCYEV